MSVARQDKLLARLGQSRGRYVDGATLSAVINCAVADLPPLIAALRRRRTDLKIEGKAGFGYRLTDPTNAAAPRLPATTVTAEVRDDLLRHVRPAAREAGLPLPEMLGALAYLGWAVWSDEAARNAGGGVQ